MQAKLVYVNPVNTLLNCRVIGEPAGKARTRSYWTWLDDEVEIIRDKKIIKNKGPTGGLFWFGTREV